MNRENVYVALNLLKNDSSLERSDTVSSAIRQLEESLAAPAVPAPEAGAIVHEDVVDAQNGVAPAAEAAAPAPETSQELGSAEKLALPLTTLIQLQQDANAFLERQAKNLEELLAHVKETA
jgi:hypothetical protein